MENKSNVIMQGIADVSRYFNQMRSDELLKNLKFQDTNLENALNELEKVRDFYSAPEHILGNSATKHGEIAEHMQVGFENADRLIVGENPTHTFEGIGRTAPEDYLKNGIGVQSKFVQKDLSIDAIIEHLSEYPDFITNGKIYDIPRDYYEQIQEWLKMSPNELANLPNSENGNLARRVVNKVRQLETENNVKFEDMVYPAQIKYSEAQINTADNTVDLKEQKIIEVDSAERQKYTEQAKASIKEGFVAAGISAAIDGVISFSYTIVEKLQSGKKISEFSNKDWEDILKDTGIGIIRGGTMGGGIYALTNYTNMSAPVAAALVTALIGIVNEAIKLGKGMTNIDDFMYNIIEISTESAVSGAGAFIGQIVIPVPIIGAMTGSFVSTAILHFIKNNMCGGNYYSILHKAEYEYMFSSTYNVLANALDTSQHNFENAVNNFHLYMKGNESLIQQSVENQSNLQNLLESI